MKILSCHAYVSGSNGCCELNNAIFIISNPMRDNKSLCCLLLYFLNIIKERILLLNYILNLQIIIYYYKLRLFIPHMSKCIRK